MKEIKIGNPLDYYEIADGESLNIGDIIATNASGKVAVSNIHKDEVEVLVNPFITTNDWYLLCTNRGIKPFAVQKRKTGNIVTLDKDSDGCAKNNNENEYGIHYRGAAAAIAPHLVIKGANG